MCFLTHFHSSCDNAVGVHWLKPTWQVIKHGETPACLSPQVPTYVLSQYVNIPHKDIKLKFLRENSNSRLLFTDPFIHGRPSFPCCLEFIKSCQVSFKQRRRYWIIHSCLVYFVDNNCCNCARCATYGVVSAVTE